MGYNKYTDQLLAQQTTIPANKIFAILLGSHPNALIDTKIVKRGSSLADKKKLAKSLALQSIDEKAFRRAKKEKIESWRRQYGKTKGEVRLKSKKGNTLPNSPSLVEMEAIYLKKIIATEAHSILKEWMELKFHKDLKDYPMEEFFITWIDSDEVLKKLETQVKGFKTHTRAREFIGYVKEGYTSKPPIKNKKKKPQVKTLVKKSKKKASTQKKKNGHSRADPYGKIIKAIKKLKGGGVLQTVIPYKSAILMLLPNKDNSIESIGVGTQ